MGLGYHQMESARVAGMGSEVVDTVSEPAEMDFVAADTDSVVAEMEPVEAGMDPVAGTEPVEPDTDSVAEMVLPGTDLPPEPLAPASDRLRS